MPETGITMGIKLEAILYYSSLNLCLVCRLPWAWHRYAHKPSCKNPWDIMSTNNTWSETILLGKAQVQAFHFEHKQHIAMHIVLMLRRSFTIGMRKPQSMDCSETIKGVSCNDNSCQTQKRVTSHAQMEGPNWDSPESPSKQMSLIES